MENQEAGQEQQVDSAVELEDHKEEGQSEPDVVTKQESEPELAPAPVESEEPESGKTSEPEPEKQAPETAAQPVEPEKPQDKQPEGVMEKAGEPGMEKQLEGEPDKSPDQEQGEKMAAEPEKAEPEHQPEAGETAKSEAELAGKAEKQEESESKEVETQGPQESENDQAATVAEGSLPFAFLDQEATVAFIRSSRTLFILRGLPGSGKSHLANAISTVYEGLCVVVCADNYGVKPEKYGASMEGFKAVDKAVVESCTSGVVVVVVDDTNHTHSRLARLGELAEEHQYLAFYVEPRTGWSSDVEQLSQKTHRKLDKNQIRALAGPMSETSLPLFFGWFLSPACQEKLRRLASDFLKMLGGQDAFKKHIGDFSGDPEKGVDLEQYFSDKGALHCTTKYCDYGKSAGAKEYAEKPAVRESYGSVTQLEVTALFITPRTAGARISLSEAQLQLWPTDAEKEAMPDADLPLGSRAHVTLGCAEGMEPVQTGVDLLEMVLQQQRGDEGECIPDVDLGTLTYYSKGAWMLTLGEPIRAKACFSSYYGQKEDGGKEPEKKKKLKCTVM